MYGGSNCSTFFTTMVVIFIFTLALLVNVTIVYCDLIYMSLVTNNDHLFMCRLYVFLGKKSFKSFSIFKLGYMSIHCRVKPSLFIFLDPSVLSDKWFSNIFSYCIFVKFQFQPIFQMSTIKVLPWTVVNKYGKLMPKADESSGLHERGDCNTFQMMGNRSTACTNTGWIPVVLSQFSIYLAKASENCQVSKSVACQQESVKGCK